MSSGLSPGASMKRMSLSADQRAILEAVYNIEKLPDGALRERLSTYLSLSARQIQVWPVVWFEPTTTGADPGSVPHVEFSPQVSKPPTALEGSLPDARGWRRLRRAIDVLAGLDQVNPQRLGCYGHSMGSTHTWLVGPWEPRLKCLVGNCCLPTYKAIHDRHMLHCFPNFVPGIHAHGDTPDIAALIAPRALHLNFGETDSGSPIDEVRRGVEVITKAYEAIHAQQNFSSYIENGSGHVLSPEMWRRTKDVFARHLKA